MFGLWVVSVNSILMMLFEVFSPEVYCFLRAAFFSIWTCSSIGDCLITFFLLFNTSWLSLMTLICSVINPSSASCFFLSCIPCINDLLCYTLSFLDSFLKLLLCLASSWPNGLTLIYGRFFISCCCSKVITFSTSLL